MVVTAGARRLTHLSAAALLGLVTACGIATPSGPGQARVLDIIDGDTIEVVIAERVERVRLLGIDTPETVHPGRNVECFGPEASARLGELLVPGSTVRLERDVEARDRFGRLLAYAHRPGDPISVNEQMVVEGYARVLMIEPNRALASALRAAEARARADGAGLWGRCHHRDGPGGR